ncbi:uncharacterized protein LOC129769353 [Toxorhynchites rutilus septentrionalis]|uniref:uncharacterized protein LOC129769353 n=1 Tax=Toxorhynchites rutilus septentrionalis TaxID=329112 RepID=UPI00247A6659|nr:uncharacterized protein LOC129769353 [Toxorhynchites rutilus septentrionalis]
MDWLVKITFSCGLLVIHLCTIDSKLLHHLQTRQTPDNGELSNILQQYPNGAFDDRKPDADVYNEQYKDYVNVLTRFDDWVTGHTHVRNAQEILPDFEFNDPKPQINPNNQQYNNYVSELIRFDDWATGHPHIRGPQDVLPDDEFNDPKPVANPTSTAYKQYVDVLTRFDPWITGLKVPIPADPATDALHQDYGNDNQVNQNAGVETEAQRFVGFGDHPPKELPNQRYNDYVKELTRFDPWVTGTDATNGQHKLFRRSVISEKETFASEFSDRTPKNPAADPSYSSFVTELKRFDPWITGQKVPIPRDPTTDALHHLSIRSNYGNRA